MLVPNLLFLCLHLFNGTWAIEYLAENDQEETYILVTLIPQSGNKYQSDSNQIILNEHLRNLGKLTDLGVILNVATMEGGKELLFMEILDMKNAESILLEDPAIREGLYRFEILEMYFEKGGLCDPSIPMESQPYDMVTFNYENDIASYKTNVAGNVTSMHNQHLNMVSEMEEVIALIRFTQKDGEMVIVERGTSSLKAILNDPAAEQGYLSTRHNILWINKGSFCEN